MNIYVLQPITPDSITTNLPKGLKLRVLPEWLISNVHISILFYGFMKYEQGHIVHQRFMFNEVNVTSVGHNVRRLFVCAFVCLILNMHMAAIRATKVNKSLEER